MTTLTSKQHYVPVHISVFNAAEKALGDLFTGTINQLDEWIHTQTRTEEGQRLAEKYRKSTPYRADKYRGQYIWTVYLES
jgi:hypothetical protein